MAHRAAAAARSWPCGERLLTEFSPARLSATFFCVVAVISGSASAADPTSLPVKHTRRGGLLVGVALGPAIGGASGYPNDARKIDRPEHFSTTGVSLGGAGSLWLGVAFTDWLSLSLAGYGGAMVAADVRTGYSAAGFRVEAFPAFMLGGALRELGTTIEAGLGSSDTRPKDGGDSLVQSGGGSRVAFGVSYEGVRIWKLSMGPFASFDLLWSSSAVRSAGWFGWRTTLYTSP